MDFLKEIVNEIGDDFTKLAADIDETETYVDTGSFIFNALVSGSFRWCFWEQNYCYCWGKLLQERLFSHSQSSRTFLDTNPDGYCLYFDTEAAVNKIIFESRASTLHDLRGVNVVTVEEFLA